MLVRTYINNHLNPE